MANNALIGFGIIGILGTGSVAVVTNTQSLVSQDASSLVDASEVLVPTQTTPIDSPAPDVVAPTPVEPAVSDTAPTPAAPAPAPTPTPAPTPAPQTQVAPATPAPAPVDATSSGSASYSDDDHDDDHGDDHDDDHDDDDDDDDDD